MYKADIVTFHQVVKCINGNGFLSNLIKNVYSFKVFFIVLLLYLQFKIFRNRIVKEKCPLIRSCSYNFA